MAGEIQIGGTTFATESGGTVTVSNVDSATNRQNLGLEIGVDVQQYDADTTKNDVANTFTTHQIISVTDNTNAALRVTQLGTGNALVVEDETNPDSSPFIVDSSGNVGIGSSPSNPFQVGSSDLIIDSSGNLLVGTTDIDAGVGDTSGTDEQASYRPSQGYRQKNGTNFYNRTATGDFYRFRYQGSQVGSISIGTTATGFNTSSDYRLKENITEITDGITRVKQLNPSRFNFIADPENTVDGFIAHEIQNIVPEAISGEKDAVNEDGSIKPQGIDQSKLVPLLTAALQESIALIESQQSQIDALTARIEALETT